MSNMLDENVVQPLLVTTSALNLATECVRMILKVHLQHRSSVVSCGKDMCICRTSDSAADYASSLLLKLGLT